VRSAGSESVTLDLRKRQERDKPKDNVSPSLLKKRDKAAGERAPSEEAKSKGPSRPHRKRIDGRAR
jgi:hypothetical protein